MQSKLRSFIKALRVNQSSGGIQAGTLLSACLSPKATGPPTAILAAGRSALAPPARFWTGSLLTLVLFNDFRKTFQGALADVMLDAFGVDGRSVGIDANGQ